MSVESVGDALKFLLILGIDMRPENFARGLAEERPVTLGATSVFELDGVEGVGNFGCEEISVLVADFGGRTLEMDVDPLVAFEAVGLLERVGLRSGEGEGREEKKSEKFMQRFCSPVLRIVVQ